MACTALVKALIIKIIAKVKKKKCFDKHPRGCSSSMMFYDEIKAQQKSALIIIKKRVLFISN
jgi:hypothetical protein